ncbi:iron-containing alcohol dehydrogenase [Atopobium sp. oral taxon 416]|uniref:iron-containing alcohol dehydrogenase n=1 Tax=Atopobium sp. oral taxon 416 TaxID=712157 RepID=UPI001BA85932|nr:iron-containing alcohol dehydrogenase [Atopobium sp. oral taxon 416]QUC02433.1 iron-containing alcohol dehydrogenase [Atopobium sp. oral taxon 416]
METYNFFDPVDVHFGPGQLKNLHTFDLPGKKAMIVTSNGKSTITNGSLATTKSELDKAGVEYAVFNKVSANPLKETVEEGAQFACDNNCDFVIALGGGSVMDAAKNMAMLAPQDTNDLWDFVFTEHGKGQVPQKPSLPWVAITTSAGTGSEVDTVGVVTNTKTDEKIGVGGFPDMWAKFAIVDPELMTTVPPKFTAYQGFDALFHSLEGYIANTHNIMGDMVERAAIENIGRYLPRAIKDGNNMEARAGMAFANTMSGYSMVVSSCTSEHSMEHAMSAYHTQLPHGAGLIMISVAYFQYWINRGIEPDRFVDMAKFLGKTDATKPQDFIVALKDLQKACGVDNLKMSDYGIQKDEARKFAKNAMTAMGMLFKADPAEMSEDDCTKIYKEAYK